MRAEILENTMPVPFCGCLFWMGGMNGSEKGMLWLDGKQEYVSRVVLGDKLGIKLSREQYACHSCDIPICVNEAHLFLGDAQINMTDKVNKERQARLFANKNGATRLSTDAVAAIKRSDLTQQRLADLYGVSQTQIWRIRNGIRSGRTGK